MALFAAITAFAAAPEGFTHKTLRQRVAALHKPGPKGYTAARLTYDLRRLRLKGLIKRIAKSHRYMLTALGRRVALHEQVVRTYCQVGPIRLLSRRFLELMGLDRRFANRPSRSPQ